MNAFRRFRFPIVVLIVASLVFMAACTTPRAKPDGTGNQDGGTGVVNDGRLGDSNVTQINLGAPGMVPTINTVKNMNPKIMDYRELRAEDGVTDSVTDNRVNNNNGVDNNGNANGDRVGTTGTTGTDLNSATRTNSGTNNMGTDAGRNAVGSNADNNGTANTPFNRAGIAGLTYHGPADNRPGIRLLVNRAGQVIGVQVHHGGGTTSGTNNVTGTSDNRTSTRNNDRNDDANNGNNMNANDNNRFNATGAEPNMAINSTEVIYFVDPDTINNNNFGIGNRDAGGTSRNNDSGDGVTDITGTTGTPGDEGTTGNTAIGRDGTTPNGATGRGTDDNRTMTGMATMTIENLRAWNPSLKDLRRVSDFIPGVGYYYSSDANDSITIIADKNERVTGVKANFPDRVQWQTWFDQPPFEVVTRNERNNTMTRSNDDNLTRDERNNTGTTNGANNDATRRTGVQTNLSDKYYTQHLMLASPTNIR